VCVRGAVLVRTHLPATHTVQSAFSTATLPSVLSLLYGELFAPSAHQVHPTTLHLLFSHKTEKDTESIFGFVNYIADCPGSRVQTRHLHGWS
jgi:hypothetical protein